MLRVEVTHEDIDAGVRRAIHHCPVHIAIKRALREQCGIEITDDEIGVYADRVCFFGCLAPSEQHQDVNLPRDIGEWIRDFDSDLEMGAFGFQWDIDCESLKVPEPA